MIICGMRYERTTATMPNVATPYAKATIVTTMPTYQDPGVFMKCCCPPCAVYEAQGCICPQMCFACYCSNLYTMLCWDPTIGGPPQNVMVVQQQVIYGQPGQPQMIYGQPGQPQMLVTNPGQQQVVQMMPPGQQQVMYTQQPGTMIQGQQQVAYTGQQQTIPVVQAQPIQMKR